MSEVGRWPAVLDQHASAFAQVFHAADSLWGGAATRQCRFLQIHVPALDGQSHELGTEHNESRLQRCPQPPRPPRPTAQAGPNEREVRAEIPSKYVHGLTPLDVQLRYGAMVRVVLKPEKLNDAAPGAMLLFTVPSHLEMPSSTAPSRGRRSRQPRLHFDGTPY